jgi:1,2-diacylglycerol 3-alpha-glucosyltransferase
VINVQTIWRHTLAIEYLARVRRAPLLLSLARSSDVLEEQNPIVRSLSRRTIAAATAVAPNSTRYLGREADEDKVTVIPFGVDTTEIRPESESTELRRELAAGGSRAVLFSAQRLVPLKRVDVLLDVLAELLRRGRDVVLVIAGEGPERRGLEEHARRLDLGSRARFVGHVPGERLPTYFQAADAFVYHSMSETFGVVFAQAMAAGLPIVAANASGIPHVVHAENGALIEPFDVAGFADAIGSLLDDDALRGAIGRRNRLRAEREFEWDAIADRYEKLLLSLASTAG